jgi:hypothetical protein
MKRLLTAAPSHLLIVAITITADRENPFEIFESLNATRLALEEADLIRNSLFMQVSLEERVEHRQTPRHLITNSPAHDENIKQGRTAAAASWPPTAAGLVGTDRERCRTGLWSGCRFRGSV